jgi:XTP/dITP diphosphohydrolase
MEVLIFATNNMNKVAEIKSLLNNTVKILSLKEAGINIDIPEPFDTIEENAIEKSRVIYELTKIDCFAEDTGLQVRALNGEPGVRSARYAGDENHFIRKNTLEEKNIDKLLDKLRDITDRSAQFKTVISLMVKGKHDIFEGLCKGTIIAERRGTNGFGYDSVFIPDGSKKTFAEMDLWEKNIFSHRKKATEKLISHLNIF